MLYLNLKKNYSHYRLVNVLLLGNDMSSLSRHLRPSLLTLSLLAVWQSPYAQQASVTELRTITVSAEAELKQALGSSIIDAEDISKRPPSNDLSEIIRSQPGINLTGNSTSGQRGNNRQIDIRGMALKTP